MIRLLSDLDRSLTMLGAEENSQMNAAQQINAAFVNECGRMQMNIPNPETDGVTSFKYVYYNDLNVFISSDGLQLNLGPAKATAAVSAARFLILHGGFDDPDEYDREYDRNDARESDRYEIYAGEGIESGNNTPTRGTSPHGP
jgi:hypothetical protein